ncbi:helix-turn-helix transcriptional regulator [Candidatus Woesearchaeota archaeon]|nr:helix-turn-helix transcriptional regulator [Candidatus Woesearchaeota archaeon]
MYSCPIFRLSDIVGKRWTIPIIQEVGLNGKNGFNAIHRRMKKMSPRLLSTRLKELENEGIIERKVVVSEIPIRTSYTLTEKGKELQQLINKMRRWYSKYHPELEGCDRRECVNCHLY